MGTIEERAKKLGEISQCRAEYPYDKTSVEFGYMAGAYDQKHIDEEDIDNEVRFKKCADIAPEEVNREVEFLDWFSKNGKGTPTYSDAIEWARKEVIENARDWLKENIYEYIAVGNTDFGKPYDIHLCDEELFEDFRNAMEE